MFGAIGAALGGIFGGNGGGFDFDFGPDARTTDSGRFSADMMPGYSSFGFGESGNDRSYRGPSSGGGSSSYGLHEYWTPVFDTIKSNYEGFDGGSEFNPLEGLELPGIEVVGDATDGTLKLSGWGLSDPSTASYLDYVTDESDRVLALDGRNKSGHWAFDDWSGDRSSIMDTGSFYQEGPHSFFEWDVPEITLDDPVEDITTNSADLDAASSASELLPASTIEGLYQSVLGRAPDAPGLEFWRSSGLEGDELREAFISGADPEFKFRSQADQIGSALWGLDLSDWRQIEEMDKIYGAMRSDFSGIAPGYDSDVVLSKWDDRVGGTLDSLKSQIEAERGRISGFEDKLYSSSDDILSRISGLSIGDQDGMDAISREIEGLRRDAGRFSSELPFDLSQELGSAGLGAADRALRDLMARRSSEETRVAEARGDFTQRADALSNRLRAGGFGDLAQLQMMKTRADRLRDSVTGFETELDADFSGLINNRLPDLDYAYESAVRARDDQLSNYEMSLEDLLADGGRIKDYNESGLRGMMSQIDALGRSASRFTGGERSDALRGSIRDARNDFSSRLDDYYARRDELPGEARGRLSDLRETEFYNTDQICGASGTGGRSLMPVTFPSPPLR